MQSERRLAAIMFTDIVGFTRLMGEDKDKAFAVLEENRRLQRKLIESHRGKWIKEMGDGVLASFPAVSDALHAAIGIQQECNRNGRYSLRIGIHHGEVEFSGNDVFGDGVNVASRIQSVALPGSVFLSAKVYDDIRNLNDIVAVPAGTYHLKNVRGDMPLFAISQTGLAVPDVRPMALERMQSVPTVLVLPFLNMGKDEDQEYFSDGLTEELIFRLSRLRTVRVVPRTTAMQYKQAALDLERIARETKADYFVEGSVRSDGHTIRINARVLDAHSGQYAWSETYDGAYGDVFAIQEKVSTRIVEALRMQLSSVETASLRKRYTENAEAYRLYLKGRYCWKQRNGEALYSAIRFFEQAIEKDSQYALAWAGIADAYSLLGEYTLESRQKLQPKILHAVNKALQLDPYLAEAHISLAIMLMLNEWDWVRAEQEFLLGIEQYPDYATGHHWYGELLLFRGRTAEAFREISLAIELDPLSQGIWKDKGIFHYYNRQYDEAIDAGRKTLELDPNFSVAHRLMSMAWCAKGEYEKALEENRKWVDRTGEPFKPALAEAYILAAAGRKDEALRILDEARLHLDRNDFRSMSMIYATLGQADVAFDWLEKSYAAEEESLCSLKVDPKFDPIRSDPRFNKMLKKIGLGN